MIDEALGARSEQIRQRGAAGVGVAPTSLSTPAPSQLTPPPPPLVPSAARFSRCGKTPLNPSAHIVQAGQVLPMLWITNRYSLSPNSSDSRTGPSLVANR